LFNRETAKTPPECTGETIQTYVTYLGRDTPRYAHTVWTAL